MIKDLGVEMIKNKSSVLVVENGSDFAKSFVQDFSEFYAVVSTPQSEVLSHLGNGAFDLVVLHQEGSDSFNVNFLKHIQATSPGGVVPALVVSENPNPTTFLSLMEAGALDCIQPVNLEDLKLRLFNAMRIAKILQKVPSYIEIGNMTLYPQSKVVSVNGTYLNLVSKEFSILLVLARQKNQILLTEDLIEIIWPGLNVSAGNLHTQMYNLKRKLKDFSGEIQTIHRVGVKLTDIKSS